jgi:integrase
VGRGRDPGAGQDALAPHLSAPRGCRGRARRFSPRADGAVDAKGNPKLEYSGLTLGQLRHLALQLALDGGATLNDVQAHARHADPKMTMRYLKRRGRKDAAAAIGRELARPPNVAGGEHG